MVVRERVREAKEAVGRKLIDVPGYTFRIFVSNRMGDPLELWRDYNKRAVIEQRIEEIKAELHADGFCMKDFFATESAFLAVLFTFNLLSLYQKVVQPEAGYRQLATLRAAAFLGGAVLGRAARKPVLLLSEAWGDSKSTSHSSKGSWCGISQLRRSWNPIRRNPSRVTRFDPLFHLQLRSSGVRWGSWRPRG